MFEDFDFEPSEGYSDNCRDFLKTTMAGGAGGKISILYLHVL
jgi:hypothetical protein